MLVVGWATLRGEGGGGLMNGRGAEKGGDEGVGAGDWWVEA